MSRMGYTDIHKTLQLPGRDSLELASLAETDFDAQKESETSSESGIASSRRLSLDDEDPLDDAAQHQRSTTTTPTAPGRGLRSYSVSSAFDYTPALFPLSSTAGGYSALGAPSTTSLPLQRGGTENLEKQKTLTYLNGLSLVVSIIVGTGIFSSPSEVNSHAGSPGASLIVWTISGLLAWTGAASFAELGGAIPLNGGSQVYLAKIFGEWMGFLFTWTAILVLKPGGGAIVAVILGEYTIRAIIGTEVEEVNPWINKAPAFLGLIVVTFLNCLSTRVPARISDLLMFFKFIALAAVTIIGIVVAATGLSYRGPANTDWKTIGWFEHTSTDISDWAVALYAGLWAFDGWDNTNYVAGEFKSPSRDIPRVLHTAMPLVISCYLLANVSYYLVLPQALIDRSNTIAVEFGSKVFGPLGSTLFALVVGVSAFGTLNAGTFTCGRIVYVAGREGYLPQIFGQLGFGNAANRPPSRLRQRSWLVKILERYLGDEGGIGHTPVNAIIFNGVMIAIYIAVGEFKSLITFYGVAAYTFYFLTVLGLVVLRIREPNLQRPYRTWITTPIIFCCVSLFLVSRAVVAQPLQTLIVVAFVLSGIPVYFWRMKIRDGGGGGAASAMNGGMMTTKRRKGVGRDNNDNNGWKFWRWRT